MTDHDLRSFLLHQFYDHRRDGMLGIGTPDSFQRLALPKDIGEREALRICKHLSQHNLIRWESYGPQENPFSGLGEITAHGIDVVAGKAKSDISIHIDRSQTVNVHGSTDVQVAGENSAQNQTVTHHVEQLIREIDASSATDEEKKEAKFKLGEFLKTKGAEALCGVGTAALLKILGL